MKQVALDVLTSLGLNYVVTLISLGESDRCEIVMWDRSRDSYFSIRVRSPATMSENYVAKEIEGLFRQRLTALDASADSLWRTTSNPPSTRTCVRIRPRGYSDQEHQRRAPALEL